MKNSVLRTLAIAGSFLAMSSLMASEAMAQRGGRGGGGARSMSTGSRGGGSSSFNRGSPSRDMQTRGGSRGNINSGGNRGNFNNNANINRNTNINSNRNVNINRDVDIDIDHDYDWGDHYHPVARATAAVATAAVIGSYYRSLPANCVTVYRGAVVYYQCGSSWYQPSYYGSTVQYVVVSAQ